MSDGYQIENPANAYFLTFQVIDWVDIFSRKIYRDILLESLDFCRKEKGLKIWAYAMMTNHVHSILSAKNENLPDLIRDFKRFTATKIIRTIQDGPESRKDWMLKRFEFAARRNDRNSHHQFWTHENHAEEIITSKFLNQKMNYIHQNPVRAGWVEKPQDWLYSSARNYMGLKGLIDIDISDH
ncbi:MAG: transposase [Saprospiraceae bacterium]|uniref:Transposase n=1 Tax=Candidatus Opimibacter skivensis TaxID=2982028 RepID=A0A9D7SV14_9BACT|nr:transposase [Candidatus Opimibacter skivensis]